MLDITRKTGLQVEIDALIARLVELRQREVCRSPIYDDNADDLRAVAGLLKDTAAAVDPVIQRMAYEAGLTSMSGASIYRSVVSDAVEGDLLFAITERAETHDGERSQINPNDEHCLTGRELGVAQ